MLIFIDESALNDPGKEFMFRSGTVNALYAMRQTGLNLLVDTASLNKEQQLVLKQEGIEYLASRDHKEYDFRISSDGKGLMVLSGKEEKIQAGEWKPVIKFLVSGARTASVKRKTSETDIQIDINLDGTGQANIDTGLKFFDHMLDQISRHGLIDLNIKCEGDLEIDEHHTIEDVAIALGEALFEALGSKKGIERYGFVLPMDEARATVALDLSGRPYLVFEGEFKREYVGDFPTEMVKHFFYSLAMNLKATLHVEFSGENDHHNIEACFKGLARTLKAAIEQNPRIKNLIPSSKGAL